MTRYELAERIGAGGMAEIFRGKALAAGGFEKPVAIKRILPHLSQDERFVELLINEAKVLSYLRHRNIVQIFDVGRGPDGQYFLVMEYVDGADLGALQEGLEKNDARLPVDLGLYIGSEVCEALEHAHSAYGPDGKPMRLVHRDVSPSNVLISRSGEVKLTDFGIAKRAEDVTRHGGVRGKFAYISPEQASSGHLDARSDVFSVGIMLFEILLARRLFSKLADFQALQMVREGRIPRPCDIDPTLPPKLDRILRRALAPSPNDRFESAGQLGKELRDVRYSMPATGGDPAKAIAGVLERYAMGTSPTHLHARSDELNSTVVRLKSAPGFTLSGQREVDRDKSYADARKLIHSFEEDVTRAMARAPMAPSNNPALGPIPGLDDSIDIYDDGKATPAYDTGEDADTMIMNRREHVPELRPTVPFDASSVARAVGPAPVARDDDEDDTAFDPSVPDHVAGEPAGQIAHRPAPGPMNAGPPGPPNSAPASLPPPPNDGSQPMPGAALPPAGSVAYYPSQAAPMAPYPGAATGAQIHSSRRTWWLLALGVVAAGVGSFFIAGAVLGGDDQVPERAIVDAAPADAADAGSPSSDAGVLDGAPAADEGEPTRAEKAEKRKKRKKRRRNKRKKRSRRSR